MKIITSMNSKGGVGKTMLAVHFAAGLAAAGANVVLIDADMQGDATTALRIPERPHFYNLLVRPDETPWESVLSAVPAHRISATGSVSGSLYVVASNSETGLIAQATDDDLIVVDRLSELEGVVDFVVFDTSPQASLLHGMIYGASDYIFIPTELGHDAVVKSVDRSIRRANRVHERGLAAGVNVAQVAGVIPNRMRNSTAMHTAMLEHLQAVHGDLIWEPIADRIAITESVLAGKTVFAHRPDTVAARELAVVIQRMIEVVQAEVTHE